MLEAASVGCMRLGVGREVEADLGSRAAVRRIERRERVAPARRARLGRLVENVGILARPLFVLHFAQERWPIQEGGIAPLASTPDGAERVLAQQASMRAASAQRSDSSALETRQAAPRVELEFAAVARERAHVAHADPAGRARTRRQSGSGGGTGTRAAATPEVPEARTTIAVRGAGGRPRQRRRVLVPAEGGIGSGATCSRDRAARRVRQCTSARRRADCRDGRKRSRDRARARRLPSVLIGATGETGSVITGMIRVGHGVRARLRAVSRDGHRRGGPLETDD